LPDLNHPGSFRDTNDFHVGNNNKNPFKGMLFVIINENTISQAETACMIFSKYPRTIYIGRNTSGANGDKVVLNLPGKLFTQFSGVAVFDSKHQTSQNIGIKPDVFIDRLPENIIQGKDEIFEYLNNNYKMNLK